VWYFSREVQRSREYMDRMRETEIALESLLNMKTRKAIVESDHAMGGPTQLDRKQLSQILTGNPLLNVDDMNTELNEVKRSGTDVMANFQEISSYIKDQHELFRSTPEDWPTKGRLTSIFGMRKSPFEDDDSEHFHRGLDIANTLGTPVHATADGIVRISSWQGGFGRLVVIDHGRGFQTYYGHNSELVARVGDHVKRGQVISYMGTSGRSTGYHLHYEVWQNGRAVNPMKFVNNKEG
jgi:murein DD-endopeptidase MepM/ murein hydrolase activator NlpD